MPIEIARKAFLNFILNIVAAKEPVQAPVVGNGMATNKIKPKNSYFSTRVALRLVLSSSQLKKPEKKDSFRNLSLIGEKRQSNIGTGSILPIIEKINTSQGSNPSFIAKGIAPRNSRTGEAATSITQIIFFIIYDLKASICCR